MRVPGNSDNDAFYSTRVQGRVHLLGQAYIERGVGFRITEEPSGRTPCRSRLKKGPTGWRAAPQALRVSTFDSVALV